MYRGDTWAKQFRFLDEDAAPVDLTGITFAAAARGSDDNLVELVITVTDAADGTLSLSLPAGGLEVDLYEYDIEADNAGAIRTWVRGRLRMHEDVTHSA